MSAGDEWEKERLGKLAASDREHARWHVAEARRRLENAVDAVKDARNHLKKAKLWRVKAHHWARRRRDHP
jgi:hypothetical protein